MSDKLSHLRHKFGIGKALYSTSQIEFNTIKNRRHRTLEKMEHGVTKFQKLAEQNKTSTLRNFVVFKF